MTIATGIEYAEKKVCLQCKIKFIAHNPSALRCLDCRYSVKHKRESNPYYSSRSFLRLFDNWIMRLSENEKEYIVAKIKESNDTKTTTSEL